MVAEAERVLHASDELKAKQRAYRALLAPLIALSGAGGERAGGKAIGFKIGELAEPLVVRGGPRAARRNRQTAQAADGAADEHPDSALDIEANGSTWLFG
mmetsp:Transcript_24006/g.60729  ORF Transcript_24006/g.60729 Transcript_24006/m.60729 type:complete len:100 (+) Transcript_24006:727-1026(+)